MRLVLENISKRIRSNSILKNINLSVPESEMIAIVGENGSGKTTLLKISVGDWKADTGKVTASGKLGYCPQEPRLFPQLSVKENFEYFGSAYRLSDKQLRNRQNYLSTYYNFSNYCEKKVEELSGGTRQKLNLSIALLNQPDLLILDEPYAGFDIETYTLFRNQVNELKKSGCSIIMVTHMVNETKLFDKIYHLSSGVLK